MIGGGEVTLAQQVLEGNRRALARFITLIENRDPVVVDYLADLFPFTGHAHVVGVTGPPGAGKSTLLNRIVLEIRRRHKTVGVIAVDPTSPFTGGAILGDRIRMQELTTDPGVYIRSMGTRGSLGGLTSTTHNVVNILDAFGKDYIFVETVGVGQSEVDIIKTADTTVVTLVPGLGDDIQSIKAGILEIADLFVINKADRPEANRLLVELEMMLGLSNLTVGWRPPLMSTVAITGEGVAQVVDQIEKHWDYLNRSGLLAQRRDQRHRTEVKTLVEEGLRARFIEFCQRWGGLEQLIQQMATGAGEPQQVARALVAYFLEQGGG